MLKPTFDSSSLCSSSSNKEGFLWIFSAWNLTKMSTDVWSFSPLAKTDLPFAAGSLPEFDSFWPLISVRVQRQRPRVCLAQPADVLRGGRDPVGHPRLHHRRGQNRSRVSRPPACSAAIRNKLLQHKILLETDWLIWISSLPQLPFARILSSSITTSPTWPIPFPYCLLLVGFVFR